MSRPTPVAKVVGELVQELSKRQEAEARLWAAWEKAAGVEAVGHTRRLMIKQGVLQATVDSSTWAHDLTLRSGPMVLQLQSEAGMGDVRTIRFRLG